MGHEETRLVSINEDARRRFEEERRSGGQDPIESYLPPADDPLHAATLRELVLIDIELAWKQAETATVGGRTAAAPTPSSVESYLVRFPGLRTPETCALLLEEEFRAQRRRGEEPLAESYRSRYEQLFPDSKVPGSFPDPSSSESIGYSTRDGAHESRLAVGDRIGKLLLRELVGHGAFADVWRASDTELERDVAVKISRLDFSRDGLVMARVRREARSVAQLRHPGIVPIYSVDELDGCPCIVSEFVPGHDLAVLLLRRRPDAEEAARWVEGLADAIHYAHQCGIVHRDLKPGNILMREDGEPVITDFGLAMYDDAEAALTREGDILGTPAYMSPEQARGDNVVVDGRSDVYALGAILYELLSGKRPFSGASATVLYRVVHVEPAPPSQLNALAPLDLETICIKAMAKEPDRRYQTAGALAHDLRRYLAREPISARRVGLASRARLWVHRNRLLASVLAGACLTVLLVAAIGFWSVLEERDRFRMERDVAQGNLYRALQGEARSLVQSRETAWRWRAMDNVRQAAALPVVDRDPRVLRDLVIRAQSSWFPCFQLLRTCSGHQRPVTALEIGPQGRLMASGSDDGEVRLWDVESGETVAVLAGARSKIRSLAIHPQGGLVAAADDDGEVRVWEFVAHGREALGTLQPARVLEVDDDSSLAVAFSPDGSRIVALCADGRMVVLPVGAASIDEAERVIQAHAGVAWSLGFAHDGDTIVTAGADRLVRAWNAHTGEATGAWRINNPARALTPSSPSGVVAWASPENMGFGQLDVSIAGSNKEGTSLHDDAVHELAWVPTVGLVTASADGSLKCWSGFTELAEARGNFGAAYSLGVNPAGNRVAAGYADGGVRVWELSTPGLRAFWQTNHAGRFLGESAVLASDQQVMDYSQGMPPEVRPLGIAGIHSLSLHPTRPLVVLGRADGEVTIHDLLVGQDVHRWQAHGGQIVDLEFSPDGSQLASLGAADEGARIWSWESEALLTQLDPDVGPPHDSVWSVDGDSLFVTGRFGLALCRATGGSSNSPTRTLLREHDLSRAALARVGDVLVGSAPQGEIEIRDGRSGELRRTLVGHAELVGALQVSPSGELLASAGGDQSIRIWRTADWMEVSVLALDGSAPRWLAFGPEDRVLLAGGSGDGVDVVWDLSSREILAVFSRRYGDRCVALDTATGALIAGDLAGGLSRVSPQEIEEGAGNREPGTPTPSLSPWHPILPGGHHDNVWGLATSPDGGWIATAAHDGEVKLWNAATLSHRVDLLGHKNDIGWCAAFSPDSRLLASGLREISVWQIPSGEWLQSLAGHDRLTVSLEFHPLEGHLLFSCSFDGTLRVWDTLSGQNVGVLYESDHALLQLDISADGHWLALGSKDQPLLLWDLRSNAWAPMRRGEPQPPIPPDHQIEVADSIWAVAISPDSAHLAGGTANGVVHLWDMRTHTLVANFEADLHRVRSLDWSRDGRYLAAGCHAGRSITWDLQALRKLLGSMDLEW